MTLSKYESQLDAKHKHLSDILRPFYSGKVSLHDSPPSNYRMRAEFRIWHEGDDSFHIMFDPETKKKFRVDEFSAGSHLINLAMNTVMASVRGDPILRDKLYQVDYLSTLSNELLVTLIYRKPIDDSWTESAKNLRQSLFDIAETDIIGRARKQKVLVDKDYVTEKLTVKGKTFSFKQIENSFTQPNAHVNQKMIEWTIEQAKGLPDDLLELYCGAGNFSIPLSKHFNNVLGTEISKTSVKAAQTNISGNQITNLKIAKLSSEEFTDAYLNNREFRRLNDIDLESYAFSTILVDPPRAGIDGLTEKLVSHFDNVIYISCNPHSLANNLRTLTNTHSIERAALFDQFPFTPHIECGVMLTRNC